MIAGQARRIAAGAIGDWPGSGVTARATAARAASQALAAGARGDSLSARHAARVWESVRADVTYRAGALAGIGGMTAEGVAGAARLAFLTGVSEHVVKCGRCAGSGLDAGGTGAEWLAWGLGCDGMMRAVWVAVAGRGGAQGLKLPSAAAGARRREKEAAG